ncbi:unnamed protein product [Mytilus coruscus]|uniref:Short-chain collagen C4-like n=1 Tax=Mytilus coruscus TaxID=42192 RepID=A0A6J8BDU3_MYTCO|nr:unnamed protein product [Mytilus coruscus]
MLSTVFLLTCSLGFAPVSSEMCDEYIITRIERELKDLRNDLQHDRTDLNRDIKFGSTFTRWGRKNCPQKSSLIYDGYMTGKKQNRNGGGSNYLCLPKNPEYTNLQSPNIARNLYGVETDINGFHPDIANKDASCAVCITKNRASVLMIPGRKSCPTGWNVEYWGYLMSEGHHSSWQPTEYVCVDNKPVGVPGGDRDNGDSVVYLVGGMCGSLKCPPYVNGKPLTCVVCSK